MEKESFKEILPKIFDELFKKTVSKDLNLPVPIIRKSTDPFIDKFCGDNLVDVGNCIDFVILQIYTWKEWHKWKDRFALSWCFGDKAIERFKNTKPGAKYYQDEWLKTFNLNRDQIKMSIFDPKKEHPMRKFVSNPSDDSTKDRFLNTDIGFKMCINDTLMWSPDSKVCMACNYVANCKTELNKIFPELLRLREESLKNK